MTTNIERGASNGNGERPRRLEFPVADGGIIREADLSRDIPAVVDLYKEPHVIEHLADVTPSDTPDQTLGFYFAHPDAKLFVPALPDGRIIGSMTVVPEGEGLRSAKFTRLATAADYRRRGVADASIEHGLSYAFSPNNEGGLGVSQVIVAVIVGIPGSDIATSTFEKHGFDFHGIKLETRCQSWDLGKGELVWRDVRQMILQRSGYEMRQRRISEPPAL